MSANVTHTHSDLSHQYGCRAHLTSVTFTHAGNRVRASRFFRADMPGTGKVELYIILPDGMEEFLRYADAVATSDLARLAARHLDVALAMSSSPDGMSERYSNLELAA